MDGCEPCTCKPDSTVHEGPASAFRKLIHVSQANKNVNVDLHGACAMALKEAIDPVGPWLFPSEYKDLLFDGLLADRVPCCGQVLEPVLKDIFLCWGKSLLPSMCRTSRVVSPFEAFEKSAVWYAIFCCSSLDVDCVGSLGMQLLACSCDLIRPVGLHISSLCPWHARLVQVFGMSATPPLHNGTVRGSKLSCSSCSPLSPRVSNILLKLQPYWL